MNERIKEVAKNTKNGILDVIGGFFNLILKVVFFLFNPFNFGKIIGIIAFLVSGFLVIENTIGWNRYAKPIRDISLATGRVAYNLSIPVFNFALTKLKKAEKSTAQPVLVDAPNNSPKIIHKTITSGNYQRNYQGSFFAQLGNEMKGIYNITYYALVTFFVLTCTYQLYKWYYKK